MNIYGIENINLLKGSHSDTGKTGQGCFMNVISYLNGEAIITDNSSCVCFVSRRLFVWANDWMTDQERKQLLPFILRALGSYTKDGKEVSRRLGLIVKFAKKMSSSAADAADAAVADAAADAADAYAAEAAVAVYAYAAYAAADAAADAVYAAADAYNPTKYKETRQKIIVDILELFDNILPKLSDLDSKVVTRISELQELAAV